MLYVGAKPIKPMRREGSWLRWRLTPPDRYEPQNDGLLTASEITQLRLDADLVILSACNTAAAASRGTDAIGAESLSGLARAFFYAGTRALLVSYWYVDSAAAVELMTATVKATKDGNGLGTAEALRRSMVALSKDESPRQDRPPFSHPSVWGPFSIVGDGRLH
jgi:CHAT domain-containing protein